MHLTRSAPVTRTTALAGDPQGNGGQVLQHHIPDLTTQQWGRWARGARLTRAAPNNRVIRTMERPRGLAIMNDSDLSGGRGLAHTFRPCSLLLRGCPTLVAPGFGATGWGSLLGGTDFARLAPKKTLDKVLFVRYKYVTCVILKIIHRGSLKNSCRLPPGLPGILAPASPVFSLEGEGGTAASRQQVPQRTPGDSRGFHPKSPGDFPGIPWGFRSVTD